MSFESGAHSYTLWRAPNFRARARHRGYSTRCYLWKKYWIPNNLLLKSKIYWKSDWSIWPQGPWNQPMLNIRWYQSRKYSTISEGLTIGNSNVTFSHRQSWIYVKCYFYKVHGSLFWYNKILEYFWLWELNRSGNDCNVQMYATRQCSVLPSRFQYVPTQPEIRCSIFEVDHSTK